MTVKISGAQSAHILLVEDDPDDVKFIKRAFAKVWVDYELHVASDGEQALAMLRRSDGYEDEPKPDLILLDLNMPKMNGFEVLDSLKSDSELCQIPVVVLTTSNDREAMAKAYQLHANSFISKPVTSEELNRMVEMVAQYWFNTVGMDADAQ